MKVSKLFNNVKSNINILGISSNSKDIKNGYMFFALDGATHAGQDFVEEAILNGAICIVTDNIEVNYSVLTIHSVNPISDLSRVLRIFYEKDILGLKLIGVTGTDGKTTTSTYIDYLLNNYLRCGYIGTNGVTYADQDIPTNCTTLPLYKNYEYFKEMKKLNIMYACLEVSSEGIINNRIDGLKFGYTIFTNLSHEHLNTHKTMDNYFLAKYQLFKQLSISGIALINNDDPYSDKFYNLTRKVTFSINSPSDVRMINIRRNSNYTKFDLIYHSKVIKNLEVNKTETYNLYNILPGIIIAINEGMTISDLRKCLLTLPIVKGRLEKITSDLGFNIFIDFAHTPNALKSCLEDLKYKTKNNIILVCGAAGEKDIFKRPIMGRVACEYADFVFFTSEDPKSEDPIKIIDDLISDIDTLNYKVVLDRSTAIKEALQFAEEGDTVIITGKGRESFFIKNSVVIEYSDFDVVNNFIFNR